MKTNDSEFFDEVKSALKDHKEHPKVNIVSTSIIKKQEKGDDNERK